MDNLKVSLFDLLNALITDEPIEEVKKQMGAVQFYMEKIEKDFNDGSIYKYKVEAYELYKISMADKQLQVQGSK